MGSYDLQVWPQWLSGHLARTWTDGFARFKATGERNAQLEKDAQARALNRASTGEIRLLIQFMSEVGAAMNGAGDATTFIRRTLQRIGRAYGLENVGVFVVPTLLLLRYGDDESTFVDLSSKIPADLRLDQTAALYELISEAGAGAVSPSTGLLRLREILATSTRFPPLLRIIAVAVVAGGIVLTLEPSLQEVLLSLGLGLLVGVLNQGGQRWPQMWPLVPATAGLLVGAVAFLLIDQGIDCRPLRVIVPPLAIFLPGAALTVSMIELSNGDIVAGGSRLAYGTIRLFLLIFGVLIAAQWVGLQGSPAEPESTALTEYGALLGLVVFTLGVYVHFSGPQGSFPWLLLVVAAAWAGQQFGNAFLGGSLGGFVGGASMIIVARSIATRPGAPPLMVSFTPAFWLLVPGAIGFEGLSRVFQESLQAGIDDLLAMLVTMIAIALGVLFGLIVSGSEQSREPY